MSVFRRIFGGKPEVKQREKVSPNPHLNPKVRSGFSSNDVGRLLSGWTTSSNTIDQYLSGELRELRARSREMVRQNPYGKRFINTVKSNVVGPNGVTVQAQTMMGGKLDSKANDAIEMAFKDWACYHCDFKGLSTFVDLQNLAISCAAQDGEFIFRVYEGRSAGKYGIQVQAMDAEFLAVEKNGRTKSGGEIRLGVEYDKNGKVVRYWFREQQLGVNAGYTNQYYSIDAKAIIHGYLPEWPDQSRGIPWMHSGLERAKHLAKYEEAAIVKARSTAATMAVMRSAESDAYTGDEEGYGAYEGATLDQYEPGTIKDIGNREIQQLDSDYPHQMYGAFVKTQLQGLASGLGISYHALSNDLEGVNYSSIRAGVLEDREIYKGLQNWFIRSFVRPVFERWLSMAVMKGVIKIGSRPLARPIDDYMAVHFQPRRWAWVDPQKDGTANQMALDNKLKSPSQIMREQGDDPESVWREYARDVEMMKSLGLSQAAKNPVEEGEENDE